MSGERLSVRGAGFALSALALLYVMWPNRAPEDAGLLRLAGTTAPRQAPDAWAPLRMRAPADVALSPLASEPDARALLADRPSGEALTVVRSLGRNAIGLPPGAAQGLRLPADTAAEPAGWLAEETDNDEASADLGRRGWLGETVRAADRAAAAVETPVYSDFSDVLGNSVFGRNNGGLGRSPWASASWKEQLKEDDEEAALLPGWATPREERSGAETDAFGAPAFEGILPW